MKTKKAALWEYCIREMDIAELKHRRSPWIGFSLFKRTFFFVCAWQLLYIKRRNKLKFVVKFGEILLQKKFARLPRKIMNNYSPKIKSQVVYYGVLFRSSQQRKFIFGEKAKTAKSHLMELLHGSLKNDSDMHEDIHAHHWGTVISVKLRVFFRRKSRARSRTTKKTGKERGKMRQNEETLSSVIWE